jgi:hypothetical protein
MHRCSPNVFPKNGALPIPSEPLHRGHRRKNIIPTMEAPNAMKKTKENQGKVFDEVARSNDAANPIHAATPR